MKIIIIIMLVTTTLFSQYIVTDQIKDFKIRSSNIDQNSNIIYYEDNVSESISKGKVLILNWFNPY
ncbi:MAG: hypothetical protein CR982_04650 [Candidatus Cloacimonadota bacterium]|nr:MAG: hypothetical protein CR982_04650 [Candidatus Cloacimonadota bacterium]PIE77970.1 MAG: hypothetical protein CSA15_10215 [Candidatus Delongbacteria bacterium]